MKYTLENVMCPECGHSASKHDDNHGDFNSCEHVDMVNGSCCCVNSRELILLAALNAKQAELDALKKESVK